MGTRLQSTTPFREGQATIVRGIDAPKVAVFSDRSKAKSSPGSDPLKKAFGGFPPELPKRYHFGDLETKVSPKGAHYNPAMEFGRIRGKTAKGTDYPSHTSRPGENAVGKNLNRKGGNALGHAMDRVGTNVLGKPSGAVSSFRRR